MSVKIAIFSLFFFIPLFFWFKFKANLDRNKNERIASKWFKEMDVSSHGQRYVGSRSEMVLDMGSSVEGASYIHYTACQTASGREFEMKIFISQGLVINWDIFPLEKGSIESYINAIDQRDGVIKNS